MLPLAFVVFLTLLALSSRGRLSAADRVLSGLQFLVLTDDAVRQNHIATSRRAPPPARRAPVACLLHAMAPPLLAGLPYVADFRRAWSIFIAGAGTAAAGAALAALRVRAPQLSLFAAAEAAALALLLRFGAAAAFARRSHRRFALCCAAAAAALTAAALSRTALGPFDFRATAAAALRVPERALTAAAAALAALVAFALAAPVLSELAAQRRLTSPRALPFAYAQRLRAAAHRSALQRIASASLRALPLAPAALLLALRCGAGLSLDSALCGAFVAAECALAVVRLLSVHSRVQHLMFSALESVSAFDSSRSFESGQRAQAALERSLLLVPVSALSLSLHPMVAILMSLSYASSFAMSGAVREITRVLSLFVMACADAALAGGRILNVFIADV